VIRAHHRFPPGGCSRRARVSSVARRNAPAGAVLLFALLALAACGEGENGSQTAATPERVLERFEVGANVYVRALTVDASTDSLWVGTSTGVLKWFGTNAGGVSRYRDGEWKTFFPMHGLADYWVYSFASQSDGTLWIGTWAGVTRVDPVSGDFSNYLHELVNEWVYGIAVDSRDRVWFATEGGVSMFDGARWTAWTHRDGLGAANAQALPPSKNTGLGTRTRHDLGVLRQGQPTYNPNYAFSAYAAPDDTIWVGTWGGGVSRFDSVAWRNYTTADGLAGDIVYSIARDADGVFWFGTDRGLSRFDGDGWRTYNRASGLLNDHVYAVAVAPSGDVWAGTLGGVTRIGRQQDAPGG